jgi:hypothetical protein
MKADLVPSASGGRKPQRWFPDDGFYGMQADRAMMDMASNRHLPTSWRLYGICAARTNRWGHASFRAGELDKILGCKDDTRRKAMDTLRSGQIVAPDSTHLCVVLSALFWRKAGSGIQCYEEKHAEHRDRLWVPYWGYEDEPGQWHSMLQGREPFSTEPFRMTRTVTEEETVTKRRTITETATATVLPMRETTNCRDCYTDLRTYDERTIGHCSRCQCAELRPAS